MTPFLWPHSRWMLHQRKNYGHFHIQVSFCHMITQKMTICPDKWPFFSFTAHHSWWDKFSLLMSQPSPSTAFLCDKMQTRTMTSNLALWQANFLCSHIHNKKQWQDKHFVLSFIRPIHCGCIKGANNWSQCEVPLLWWSLLSHPF